MNVAGINRARIIYYGMFSSFFAFYLGREHYDNIIRSLDILSEHPLDERSAKAMSSMKRRMQRMRLAGLKKESDGIFYDPTGPSVPLTASYYAQQHDDGSKRVEMINYMCESNFRRNENQYKEHEDHIEFVMLMMQALIGEEINGDNDASELSRKIFANILNGMLDGFGNALFHHESSVIYKQVALALSSFSEFERMYLDLAPPVQKDNSSNAKPNIVKNQTGRREDVRSDYSGCV